MAARTDPVAEAQTTRRADHELFLDRTFNAPRELVFKAWTEPERAKHWYCPHGFTVAELEMDVRPGGAWRKCMRSPEGQDYWRSGVFREIVPPERLVFTYFSDDPNSQPGHETVVTITFADVDGKTEMRFHQAFFENVAARDAHRGGWTQGLERLGAYVEGAEQAGS
jgi:uncharacterized protein YndB with AHSA1/START domain